MCHCDERMCRCCCAQCQPCPGHGSGPAFCGEHRGGQYHDNSLPSATTPLSECVCRQVSGEPPRCGVGSGHWHRCWAFEDIDGANRNRLANTKGATTHGSLPGLGCGPVHPDWGVLGLPGAPRDKASDGIGMINPDAIPSGQTNEVRPLAAPQFEMQPMCGLQHVPGTSLL